MIVHPLPTEDFHVRFLSLLIVLLFALALLGCSSPPPPRDPGGVRVNAPGVNVVVDPNK